MSDSILSTLKRLEDKAKIHEMPDKAQEIKIVEALIFPAYLVDTNKHSYQEVLKTWENKMGKKEFKKYTKELLTRIKTNKNTMVTNPETIARMIEAERKERNKFQ